MESPLGWISDDVSISSMGTALERQTVLGNHCIRHLKTAQTAPAAASALQFFFSCGLSVRPTEHDVCKEMKKKVRSVDDYL